ncbi:uncharacterized protein [Venturia canescens]|uniref:uncharacterized protein n=1 Tax=Venturia canescens TaxID=32260 RepID=UPI001C9D64E1|nr:uncharacterized protein LOC122416637 [Venturia canescens]
MEAKSFEEESSMTALAESGTEVPWTSAITASPDKMPIHNVRLMASYDMGWSTRGNGYQYDSLNGYGALIGTQSNLVLDYETRNRKCRMCDLGHPVEDHDCRLNFFGSAKAMEPEVAASLATGSQILKAHHVSVGVLIGDNDSSSICAVRKKSSHEVIKHSDFNHTSKGVKNMLYKIGKDKDPDGELSPDAIKYLHRCFTYAVAQNKGNTDAVKSAILNIPFHAFNIHRKCGTWCKYVRDPEKYSHSDITNFKNDILFEELKRVFTKLSDNADKFSAGASSQANESLNSIMSRKAPKNICYSRSESADIRYACAVGQKNEGEQYIQNAMTKVLEMSPGTRCSKFVERSDRVKKYRTMRAKTPAAKWKRRCLRNQRSQLRHNKQQTEGRTYERHMGLLEIPAVDGDSLSNYMIENDENLFVFFDLETAGLKDTCDILQIACKSGNIEFNKYMKPRHAIPSRASEIHGITSAEGELYHNGQQVFSQSASNVLEELCIYLNNFKKPCIFVAHNCSFDAPRLMRIIVNCSVIEKFKPLIAGFCDTLPLFRKKFPERKSKGQNSLTTLATETLSNISIENAHDASYDTFLLQELVRCHFSVDELAKDCKSFDDILQLLLNKPKIANTMQTLAPLDTIISCAMRKRLAIAGVNYSLIVSTFHRNEKEAIELLEQREDGKPQLIKTKKMLLKILDFLKKQS